MIWSGRPIGAGHGGLNLAGTGISPRRLPDRARAEVRVIIFRAGIVHRVASGFATSITGVPRIDLCSNVRGEGPGYIEIVGFTRARSSPSNSGTAAGAIGVECVDAVVHRRHVKRIALAFALKCQAACVKRLRVDMAVQGKRKLSELDDSHCRC